MSINFYFIIYGATLAAYLLIGNYLKVFSRLNRYTTTKEMAAVIVSISLASIAGIGAAILTPQRVSFRIVILSYLFSNLLVPGSRLGWRFFVEYRTREVVNDGKKKRTLVIGAGAGANVLFTRLRMENEQYKVLGILDDDTHKQETYLYGYRILGTLGEIQEIASVYKIEHIIIAIPSLPPKTLSDLLEKCNAMRITVNSLPPISEVMDSKFTTRQLREIDVADLLGREEVKLDLKKISSALTDKTLLVTGAGGSIGSEICRQVARFKPKRLVLLGHGENSIYLIHRELLGKYPEGIEVIPVIADVQDREKMFSILGHYRPDIVYHAAAHKHVPLMEANPIEAVKNNIWGSKNVAEAAKAAKVGNFVMISTDKAVNPPNVMGASKRIAEMIVTGLNEPSKTKFSAVRFGNVLGSRGSVVPLFKDQIAKGGPLTVTDFRMTRYFMTIPEASRLVIQAGTLARGGEIFVLDMGEPVRIVDLAKNVIRLSGYTEEQIAIVESGIRPGEKLFEELLLESEATGKNVFEKIFIGNVPSLPLSEVMEFVDSLEDNKNLKQRLVSFANNLGERQEKEIIIEIEQKNMQKNNVNFQKSSGKI